jgi:hypothetical protein
MCSRVMPSAPWSPPAQFSELGVQNGSCPLKDPLLAFFVDFNAERLTEIFSLPISTLLNGNRDLDADEEISPQDFSWARFMELEREGIPSNGLHLQSTLLRQQFHRRCDHILQRT